MGLGCSQLVHRRVAHNQKYGLKKAKTFVPDKPFHLGLVLVGETRSLVKSSIWVGSGVYCK